MLQSNHDVTSFSGLRRMGEDKGVTVIESRKVVIDFAIHTQRLACVFIGASPSKQFKKYALVHELGHILVKQIDKSSIINDLDVDYFAESLVGPCTPRQLVATALFRMLTNPIGCLKYYVNRPAHFEDLAKLGSTKGQ